MIFNDGRSTVCKGKIEITINRSERERERDGAVLLASLYVPARVSYTIWWKPNWLEKLKQQGARGTPYKPLLGDLKQYKKLLTEAWSKSNNLNHEIVPRVDPFTLNNVQKYGKVSLFWAGMEPQLIIMNPELVREILSNKLGHFGKPPQNPHVLIVTRGLAVLNGEEWAKHRRIINPAFQLEKLKGMITAFSISCNKMIEQWKNMFSHQESCEADVWPELEKLTMDIICRVAFGSNYEGKKLLELQKELLLLALEALQNLYIPGFRFVPTKKNRRRRNLSKEIRSMIRNLIQRKEASMRTGQSNFDDLLSMLLQSNDPKALPNAAAAKMDGLSTEEVIEECKQFYIAGQETTSSWLTWTMIVLAMHPDWQEKAREEVLHVCGQMEPNFEDLTQLKTITMILNEVLRLYPPVVSLRYHTYRETKIGDISLPPGVNVVLPIPLIHHDPELWGDNAEEFRPERFSGGVSKATKDQLAFLTFAWGPRICIGQSFAMLVAKMALAMILQNIAFELSPTYIHAPRTGTILLQPRHGAQIIIR